MRSRLRRWTPALIVLAVLACSDHEFHPPSEAEKVARADSMYSPALFDTIAWSSDSARVHTGNLVFADECRRCHGPLGRGGTDYAEEAGLTVPSLVEEDWAYADQIDSVRHRVFVGHAGGMPNWGSGQLTPRQIDAAVAYILKQLRPEVISHDGTLPGD